MGLMLFDDESMLIFDLILKISFAVGRKERPQIYLTEIKETKAIAMPKATKKSRQMEIDSIQNSQPKTVSNDSLLGGRTSRHNVLRYSLSLIVVVTREVAD